MTRAVGIGVLLTTMSVAGFRQDERLFGESIGLEFVVIEPGAFRMGSRDGDRDERPVHTVTISRPYELGVYEVTQAQWFAVMGTSVGEQLALARRAVGRADFQSLRGIGDNYPMYFISWTEAQAYIGRLNSLDTAYAYRLPMEAEWEYAARAGSTTVYSFGDDTERLSEHAWCCGNADATHPVGGKRPNAWGVYDVHGNVWEWSRTTTGGTASLRSQTRRVPRRGRVGRCAAADGEIQRRASDHRIGLATTNRPGARAESACVSCDSRRSRRTGRVCAAPQESPVRRRLLRG